MLNKTNIFKVKSAFLAVLLVSILTFLPLLGAGKIEGAGASFPAPIYAKMFSKYNKETGVQVNYQSIGSGGGIRQIKAETVSFGATDAFVKDKALKEIKSDKKGRQLLHIPTVLGGVSITYNFPGKKVQLKLDGPTIADIFMGKIVKWNDSKIAKLNPGLKLPSKPIIVVRRSDGSGTTSTFTEFLAKHSRVWKSKYGVGKSINWFRKSVGGKGNEGVTGQLKNIPYSIGYVSLNYALKANLPVVAVKNDSGNFVLPSVESVSEAANTKLPKDTRINLTSVKGSEGSYPISTFTWLVFYDEQNYKGRSKDDAKTLKKMLLWMLSDDAQKLAAPLYYSPLPKEAVKYAKALVDSIKYNGKKI